MSGAPRDARPGVYALPEVRDRDLGIDAATRARVCVTYGEHGEPTAHTRPLTQPPTRRRPRTTSAACSILRDVRGPHDARPFRPRRTICPKMRMPVP
jgi:hypothetical protein